jgi:hypothetical protein
MLAMILAPILISRVVAPQSIAYLSPGATDRPGLLTFVFGYDTTLPRCV